VSDSVSNSFQDIWQAPKQSVGDSHEWSVVGWRSRPEGEPVRGPPYYFAAQLGTVPGPGRRAWRGQGW
jgi:hypothetical protein